MVHIKIKEIKRQLYIQVRFERFDDLIEEIPKRLSPLQSDAEAAAFFDLPPLSDAQSVAFVKLCKQQRIRLLGINYSALPPQETSYRQGTLRNGERLALHQPTQLFGDVHAMAQISSTHTLSVFGTVEGVIDLRYPYCTLYAAKLQKAQVRIADSAFFLFSCDRPSQICYADQRLTCVSVC